MPLALAAFLAHAAGLSLGFGGVVVSAVGASAVAAAALALHARSAPVAAPTRREASRRLALLLLVAAGALRAEAARRDDVACRAAVAGDASWRVELETDAAPGTAARGRLARGGCGLRATVLVERGRVAAGDAASVRGDLLPGERGVLVRRATVQRIGGGPWLLRLRAAAARSIDATFGHDAPIARALLVADASGIPPDVRERFAAAGLVHVLSISGLHVAIIAAAARLLMAALRRGQRDAELGTLLLVALYVAVIGLPPPAVRAAAMLAAGAASRLLQRPSSSWAALAVGAALPLLLDPRTVLDLGWQLSVAGMGALLGADALARRHLRRRVAGWRYGVTRELLAGVVAGLVTLPLVAWHIGRVSLVGPLTNIAATPLVAVLQPALFLAMLLGPAPSLARFVADAAHPVLVAFDWVARAGAAVPFASVAVAPSLVVAVPLAGFATALLVACAVRRWATPLAAALACLALAAWVPARMPGAPGLAELHMMDVGQGDALALRTPRGRWVVLDAGRAWRGGDAGRTTVAPYLRRRGGEVAAFILSHPHADHAGGAATVLRALKPRVYVDPGFVAPSGPYAESLREAERAGTAWRRARPGDSLVVDGVVVTLLAPDSAWAASLRDANDASIVAMVRVGAVRFLLMGDAEQAEEAWLVGRARDDALRADVLKVGHHGSRTSSGAALVARVRPRVALVSVGRGNAYGHPSASVMARLAAAGAQVLRTDELGSVVVRTDGRTITVEADGERWAVSREP